MLTNVAIGDALQGSGGGTEVVRAGLWAVSAEDLECQWLCCGGQLGTLALHHKPTSPAL